MRNYRLMAAVSIISLVLIFQGGCKEQERAAGKPAVEKAEAKVATAKPAAENVKAKAVEPSALKKEVEAIAEGAGGQIKFDKVEVDFGEICPVIEKECEFKFKNAGKTILKIINVTKTCGCTPFTLEKKEYQPGEEGVLKVKYNPGKFASKATKHLYVKTNDANNPNVQLTIKANVTPKVEYEPKKLELMAGKENGNCPKITIKSIEGKAFTINSFSSTQDIITAKFDPKEEKEIFVIEPKVDVSKLRKGLNGTIYVSVPAKECESVTIPFSVLPEYKIMPVSLNILGTEPGKSVKKELVIANNYGADFEIASTSSQKGYVRVLKQEKADKRYTLEVEMTPPSSMVKLGTIEHFADVLDVQIKGGEMLHIACRGIYILKGQKHDVNDVNEMDKK